MKSCEHVLPKARHMTILSYLANRKFAKLDCVLDREPRPHMQSIGTWYIKTRDLKND